MSEGTTIESVFEGLTCSVLDGRITLDRAAPLGLLATAPLRGLSGWLLLARHPDVVATCFKPGQDGNQPPAYVFQLATAPTGRGANIDFRCVTWDREHRLADALADVWPQAVGRAFGQGSVRIRSVELLGRRDGTLRALRPEPVTGTCEVTLATPVLLKDGGRGWLGPETLTLTRLVEAACRRLNALSAGYGNGATADGNALADAAAQVSGVRANMRWESPERRSAVQDKVIKLCGVTGSYRLESVPQSVAELLAAATMLHVGKHACDGCGRIKVRERAEVHPRFLRKPLEIRPVAMLQNACTGDS